MALHQVRSVTSDTQLDETCCATKQRGSGDRRIAVIGDRVNGGDRRENPGILLSLDCVGAQYWMSPMSPQWWCVHHDPSHAWSKDTAGWTARRRRRRQERIGDRNNIGSPSGQRQQHSRPSSSHRQSEREDVLRRLSEEA